MTTAVSVNMNFVISLSQLRKTTRPKKGVIPRSLLVSDRILVFVLKNLSLELSKIFVN